MDGGVLIIGGAASDRILLKARLNGVRNGAEGAADGASGLAMAARRRPDAVLVLLDLPDMPPARLIAALRAMPSASDRPIIALAGTPPPDEARCALLAAGADAVLVAPPEALLLARLRSLMHEQSRLVDLRRQTAPMLGLAEGAALAPAPARMRLALVAPNPEAGLRLRRALASGFGDVAAVALPATALAMAEEEDSPDLWLIDAQREPDRGLRLLTDLRARDGGRDAGYCLLREGDPAAEALAYDLGASDVIPPQTPPTELALRLRRVMARKRVADGLRALVRDSLRLAVTDPLTGLYNRRFALGRLAGMAQAGTYAVMLMDLDRFKAVNDGWGHAAGDAVLTGVASRLSRLMRSGEMLARIGGEEFLIALPKADLQDALAVAQRLCHAIDEAPFQLPVGQNLRITASIGLALSADDCVEAVIERADQALLAAKARGRNQVTLWQQAA